jgi:NAD(P)-dependent dehydrogenase (short-subunit alcohol dehydrogenase family)
VTGELAGRSAFVTGAASGIGRAIALRLAAAGARVAVADVVERPWHGGEPTHELIARDGGTARFVGCDVSSADAVEAAVAATVAAFGCIDVVVNDAAVSAGKGLLATTDADWARVLGVNLTGAFLVCRAAVRQMLRQPPRGEVRGRIVNITSQHGMIAAPEDVAYGVSKAGVAHLTRQVAVEFARDGIVCNAVAPGKIDTGPTARSGDPRWTGYWAARTPWPRLGRPEDVASAVLFLAGDGASFLTGENLLVDGGWMAG